MKKVLFMHGGSGNHGCEAIVRTTSKLFGGPKDTVLWSSSLEEDQKYGTVKCFEETVVSEQINRFSKSYFESLFKRKVLHNASANMQIFLRDQFKGNIAVSVGGDNYCYPWSAKQAVELNTEIRKHAMLTALWGCSVDKDSITKTVCQDLSRFDLITARESLTFDILKDINPNTVKVADPAFLLAREDLPLPDRFIEGKTIGINISPMIFDYADNKEVLHKNFRNMITFLLKETDMNICLIPHVVWPYNDDFAIIQKLYNEYRETERITYIKDGNCMQLKGYIARCRFFIGARTHATIAAYSSIVPTLVIGYSIKSKGIAIDLFGTDEGYVIPVNDLTISDMFVKQCKWLIDNEEEQKELLTKTIPNSQAQAAKAAIVLEDKIRNKH